MADKYNIYRKCEQCDGDGFQHDNTTGEPNTIPCPDCGGTGEYLWGEMREEAV
jgi:DnaJ-class molecular chaperone